MPGARRGRQHAPPRAGSRRGAGGRPRPRTARRHSEARAFGASPRARRRAVTSSVHSRDWHSTGWGHRSRTTSHAGIHRTLRGSLGQLGCGRHLPHGDSAINHGGHAAETHSAPPHRRRQRQRWPIGARCGDPRDRNGPGSGSRPDRPIRRWVGDTPDGVSTSAAPATGREPGPVLARQRRLGRQRGQRPPPHAAHARDGPHTPVPGRRWLHHRLKATVGG